MTAVLVEETVDWAVLEDPQHDLCCESKRGCSRAPTWMEILTCCRAEWLLCDPCKSYNEMLYKSGWYRTASCGACGWEGACSPHVAHWEPL